MFEDNKIVATMVILAIALIMLSSSVKQLYKHICGILYTQVNKRNWLRSAYWLLSAYFFPGFAPG